MKRVLSVVVAVAIVLSLASVATFAAASKDKKPRITSISGPRSISKGKEGRFRATVKEGDGDYENYGDGDVYWESSDDDVVWIDEDTGEAEGVDYGECTIRAYIYAVDADTKLPLRSKVASHSITVRVPGGPRSAYPEYEESSYTASESTRIPVDTFDSGGGQIATSTVTSALRGSGSSFTFNNYTSVSRDTITSARTTANSLGKNVSLNFDTYNNGFDGRVKIYPSNAANMPSAMNTGVSVSSDSVDRARSLFERHFQNKNMEFIRMSQNGSLGMTVEVAAKVGLSSFGTTKYLYSYDPTTGKYQLVKGATFQRDTNNFWHITTNLGGVLIVTDSPLKKK